jgi:hypothetical protein
MILCVGVAGALITGTFTLVRDKIRSTLVTCSPDEGVEEGFATWDGYVPVSAVKVRSIQLQPTSIQT